MGPSPAREGRPIGSAGPTTSSRMDKYTPQLLDLKLGGMIGKGKRSTSVIEAIEEFYKNYNANPHRGAYSLSVEATEAYENTRTKIAKFKEGIPRNLPGYIQ